MKINLYLKNNNLQIGGNITKKHIDEKVEKIKKKIYDKIDDIKKKKINQNSLFDKMKKIIDKDIDASHDQIKKIQEIQVQNNNLSEVINELSEVLSIK